jgi:hypothetical protein
MKTTWLCVTGLVILLVASALAFSGKRVDGTILQVGIPDGAAGLVTNYVLQEKMRLPAIKSVRFEPYTLYDCCAGAAQYALGSGHLDIAILCPDAAQALVVKDRRFEIAGPVMVNSDIFIIRKGADLHAPVIGVSQKRACQQQMVTRHFGQHSSVIPMLHTAVPFAYARGIVQGAVVDIVTALSLEGALVTAADQGHDICTSVLVVKKSLKDNKHYQHFLAQYTLAVREMEDQTNLLRLLQTYVSAQITSGDVETWKKMNVRFTDPSIYPRQGYTWPRSEYILQGASTR